MAEVPQSDPPPAGPPERPAAPTWAMVIASWRWPLAFVVVAYLVFLGWSRSCDRVEQQQRAPEAAVDRAEKLATSIAERFRSGRITSTFHAALPHLLPGQGLRLEVAAFEATETFSRRDERRVLFDTLSLGTNVTEIRVPVTYRYYVPLEGGWQIETEGQQCLVRAPALVPSLPPAIHTDRLEKHSARGWLRWGVGQQMEELHRSVTPTVSERARSEDSLALVREPARRQVAAFVRRWLIWEDHWRPDRFQTIAVRFADEPAETTAAVPTLRWSPAEGAVEAAPPRAGPPAGDGGTYSF